MNKIFPPGELQKDLKERCREVRRILKLAGAREHLYFSNQRRLEKEYDEALAFCKETLADQYPDVDVEYVTRELGVYELRLSPRWLLKHLDNDNQTKQDGGRNDVQAQRRK